MARCALPVSFLSHLWAQSKHTYSLMGHRGTMGWDGMGPEFEIFAHTASPPCQLRANVGTTESNA